MLGTLTNPAAGIGAASVGNRAPPHGGGGSRGVLPLGATTTAADSKRDARAAHKRALRASGIARRCMEEEGAEAFFLWERRRRRRIPSAMREQRTKGRCERRESGAAAWRRREQRRSSSGSDDDGGGFQARCASSAQKGEDIEHDRSVGRAQCPGNLR